MDRRLIWSRLTTAMALLLMAAPAVAAAAPKASGAPESSAAAVGQKLSDPTSDVWAMFTQFGMTFSDGDNNLGDPQVAGNISFQPIMPVPIYGSGENEWRLIVRPTIPIILEGKVPAPNPFNSGSTFNSFNGETGIADMLVPLPLAMPSEMLKVGSGNLILALGPTFLFPTSTKRPFGDQQFGVGAAGVFGYKNKHLVGGIFPQYNWRVGDRGDRVLLPAAPGYKGDLSQMDLLYFFFINLPDAWQVGLNPTITYDRRASKGNQWNVPIGLVVTKTTKMGGMPVKFQFGAEYSVVSQDFFGQRFQLKLNIIPVIKPLIKSPIFGGAR